MRIYHNLTIVDEAFRILKNLIRAKNNVDLCNATEVVEKQKLGTIYAMTWRWVN